MTDTYFTDDMAERHSRTMAVDDIGLEGIQRLVGAMVGIVGAGALGGAVAVALAAAGVGRLRIIDFDRVELSNLPRQTAYTTGDVGRPKVEALAERLTALNPSVAADTRFERLGADNVSSFVQGCDVVVDCTDNGATMTMVDDATRAASIPCVLGGVAGRQAQVMSFSHAAGPASVSYRDIFGDGSRGRAPRGIFPPAPATVAALQSARALDMLLHTDRESLPTVLVLDIDLATLRCRRLAL